MLRKLIPAGRLSIIVLLPLVWTVSGAARDGQDRPLPAKDAGAVTLHAQLVKTGLYLISGGGGNSLLRLGPNGMILVDGKQPGAYKPLMAQVRRISRISDMPVRAVIVTNHHEQHTGNNAQFLAAGVQIIGHENVVRNLAAANSPGGTIPKPTITYAAEHTAHLGAVEVRLMHFGNARTSGDTVVYFPNLKVVAVGDLFAPGAPDPDFSAGGSLVEWGPVLDRILKLDFDVVVPSTGPPVTRADLHAFKTKLDTVVARAALLVKKGVPGNQLMAQLKTDDLGWRLTFTGARLERFYAELPRSK